MRDLSRFYQELEDDIKRMRMYLHNTLQLSFPELERFFSENRAKQKAIQIIEYAEESYPSVSSNSVQAQKVRYYAGQLLHLLGEKEKVDKQMITVSKQLPEFDVLISFQRIGEISAALFIGEIGDLSRFSNHKKVNAFIEIDIRRCQSEKYAGQDHINKRGNPKERKVLYFLLEI